ncbi:uncharacterized protein LOC6570099 [Drosophila grimshawi]|uniref:GH25141 n=1 Tax=Drosophila grimshawi TaxID=7222 RepID=B4JZH1_DROGR|nr:uncharacterized protein LOC6570099 [Drosophila grimshawi]EDV94093.1 GH25141 [Drosophila grimshawi]
MVAAAVETVSSAEMFVSHATIHLKQPQIEATPHMYWWCTQVTDQPQQQQQQQEVRETLVERVKQNGSTTTKATPTYTRPRIQGNEAKRQNLLQTLDNFYAVERHDSALNRVTK